MTIPVHISFAQEVLNLPLGVILPLRPMTTRITNSRRYGRITASIREVGVIEPLAVTKPNEGGQRMLLDGHLRLHALKEQSAETAPCIVADDDEAFTYNKRVNRLATVQEHYMISRALDRNVPAKMIAAALGIDEKLVLRRRSLLDGIAPEVVEMLKEKSVNARIFDILRKLKPHKQFIAVELMASMNNFTASYAQAILAATRQDDLAKPDKVKKVAGVTPEQMARMERELESLNHDFRVREATFGDDVLQLVLASRYLQRLIENKNVSAYLESRHPEILAEFRTIMSASTLDTTA